MDLRQLRYFVAIAESSSLSEAARRLHIVQPALSKRLADLEDELGAQLIVRGRLGTALTDAGRELYEHARIIEKQVESARQAVQERNGVMEGRISIGVLRTLAPALGAKIFSAIQERLSLVIPEIRVGYSAELAQLLREGRLDISMNLPHEPTAKNVPIYSERLCVVGVPSILKKVPAECRPEDLKGVPLVLSSLQPAHSLLLDLARREELELRVIGGIEDIAALLDVCEAGHAATVMSEWAARRAQAQRKLSARILSHPELIRTVILMVNEAVPRTDKVVVVEGIIGQVLEEFMTAPRSGHNGAL